MLEVLESVPWRAEDYPITVAELNTATRDLRRLISETDREKLTDFLAFNPEGGEIIPGTGGIRKARWPYNDKGKNKRLRVLYYFYDLNMPLYILAVYGEGEKLRLTKREEMEMQQLVKALVREHAERRRPAAETRSESA